MSKLKLFNVLAIAAVILVACAQPTAAPTSAPAATAAPANTAAPAATTAPAGGLTPVDRTDTVNLGWSISSPIGVTNPWSLGYTHQEGNVFMWEALSYYGIFASKEIPWLADSMTYNADFTTLTIKLNKDAAWSDGQPLTSKDVAFTFDGQFKNEKLPYHANFQEFVKDWTAPDAQTVVLNFSKPAPRFKYEVLTFKFDTGIPIVPEHVLASATVTDVTSYQGGLDMPHSGPYNLVAWDANQKIYDLRTDWWAVKAGKEAQPVVKRIVMVNIGGQVGANMDTVIQRAVNNEFDAILDVRSSQIASILKANPKVTSWTGNDPPGGYLDWWPNSLWVNTKLAPYSDPNVRKAMSLSIDRDKIDEVIYEGAKVSTIYPFPLYPSLKAFADSAPVKALEAQYNPREFNLDKSATLMTAAGFTKNGDGLWADKDGNTINGTINGFQGIHGDIAPVLVEMLRTGGFDASVNFGTDAYQNMADGKPGFYLFGHGASTVDPYEAFNLFNSAYSAAVGTTAGNNRFSRYSSPEFDALLKTMAPLSADDPAFQAAAASAMGLYWRDTIDIPIIQWLHRIPYNQTYWTNWPLASNLANGENGAFWAETGMIVITNLKKAQ